MVAPKIHEANLISRVVIVINDRQARRRGRPLSFDRDRVLAAAAEVFWRLGYEGASIADLTEAMGISAQSLYTAFSSKASLFREALDWYRANVGAFTREALDAPGPVKAVLRRILEDSAREFTRPGRPGGCMVSTAALGCATENAEVAEYAAELRSRALAAIQARLERAAASGEAPPDTDAAGLASFIGAVIQGMAIQARDGASEAQLLTAAKFAIAALAEQPESAGRA